MPPHCSNARLNGFSHTREDPPPLRAMSLDLASGLRKVRTEELAQGTSR
jgi:hypothetical protein